MSDFIEINKKYLNMQKMFHKKLISTIMGEAISDKDVELEQKDNKIQILEEKRRIPDSKFVEEMKTLDLNKTWCKEENNKIMNRLYETLTNHKYKKISKKWNNFTIRNTIKNKSKRTITFKQTFCFDKDFFIEKTS